jgi:hypothetical protein
MDSVIREASEHLAKKYRVEPEDLEYIGFTDASLFIRPGAKLLQFNIMKRGHELYGGTIAYEYGY